MKAHSRRITHQTFPNAGKEELFAHNHTMGKFDKRINLHPFKGEGVGGHLFQRGGLIRSGKKLEPGERKLSVGRGLRTVWSKKFLGCRGARIDKRVEGPFLLINALIVR